MAMIQERYQAGLNRLQQIDPEQIGRIIGSLQEIAPDFARYLIEFPFGDIYCRPGLDLRARQIAAIAALTALGSAAPQLRVHISGALNVGCSETEVTEVVMQTAIYAGFPAALNGLAVAKEVIAARRGARPADNPRD